MNVVILKRPDSRENFVYVVAKVLGRSITGVLRPNRPCMPLKLFHTEDSAIDWCLENGHTIVIDAIAEAEE